MGKKNVDRWFAPGEPTGWRKSDNQATRIRKLLKSRKGDVLSAARAVQSLANVNSGPDGDAETHRKASADAVLLYRRYRKSKKR